MKRFLRNSKGASPVDMAVHVIVILLALALLSHATGKIELPNFVILGISVAIIGAEMVGLVL